MTLQVKLRYEGTYPTTKRDEIWIPADTIMDAEVGGLIGEPLYLVRYAGNSIVLYEQDVHVYPEGYGTRRYMYVIVRKDLLLADIMVQAAHAAYESGRQYPHDADRTSIIILTVSDSYNLFAARRRLLSLGIDSTVYEERTKQLGATALATEAITEDQRKHLRKYQLLKVE